MTPVIKRAVIVGGGIGGLCAVIAMHRIGIDAVVYARVPQLNAVGAGLVMWPNAIRALRYLGVADAVLEAGREDRKGRDPHLSRNPIIGMELRGTGTTLWRGGGADPSR